MIFRSCKYIFDTNGIKVELELTFVLMIYINKIIILRNASNLNMYDP